MSVSFSKQTDSQYEKMTTPVDTAYQGALPDGKKAIVPRGSTVYVTKDENCNYELEESDNAESAFPLATPSLHRPLGDLSLSRVDVIERAMELEDCGHAVSAASLIICTFDELFRRRQFGLCDSILHRVPIEDCSTKVLDWIAKATWAARENLPTRSEFVSRATVAIRSRNDMRSDEIERLR